MPYLVEGGAQLFLLKNSRLEYQFILLSNKTQRNRGACFSPSISDLPEQLLEVTPVLLQNICKDRRGVGIVERYVDSSGQILVHGFCIGRMFELEPLPQGPIECLGTAVRQGTLLLFSQSQSWKEEHHARPQ